MSGLKTLAEFISLLLKLSLGLILACTVAIIVWKTLRSDFIILYPISVPEALAKKGFTPDVFAARVAIEMYEMRLEAKQLPRNFANVSTESVNYMNTHEIVQQIDLLDIQVPGQTFSVLKLIGYIKELIGIDDITLKINVAEDKGSYSTDIQIFGGSYADTRIKLRSALSNSTDELIKKIANTAMQLAVPYAVAINLIRHEEARCKGSSCSFQDALEILDLLISQRRDDQKWALLARAYIKWRLGRYAETIADSRSASKLDPNLPDVYLYWGNGLAGLNNHKEAIEKYQRAVELDVKRVDAYVSWGNSLQNLGKPDEAIAKLAKALAIDPKNSIAYYNLGNTLRLQGKTSEAIEKYRVSTELDPKNAIAYHNWGVALMNLRQPQYREAIEKFKIASTLIPDRPQPYYLWAKALAALNRHEEAIEKYQKATEVESDFLLAYIDWGILLTALGRNKEAIDKFKRATEIDPKNVLAIGNWGIVLAKLGQLEPGLEKLQKALELDPKNATLHYNLGHILKQLSRKKEALEKYEKAAELDPKYRTRIPR